MKSVAIICNPNRLALATVLSVALSACDSGSSLLITDSNDPSVDETVLDTSIESPTTDTITVTESPTVLGTAANVAVESVIESSVDSPDVTIVENTQDDVSSSAVATDFLADRTALGQVKIMAVGDSITHGIPGTSSYRKDFTSQLEAASCNFVMVGSQSTSRESSGNPECEDTGVIGDGWGWDGTQSCLVGVSTATDVYLGAHEGYSAHRADHFLTGHDSSSGSNAGIQVAMQTYTPDVVLLHVGSVDLFNQQGVGNALNDVEEVLNTIYQTKPETLVLIGNIIPWYSDNPYAQIGEDIASLGDGIEQMVSERSNPLLKLVDVRSGFAESMMVNDLIHPNATGEAHIADAFMNVYQPLANCQPF